MSRWHLWAFFKVLKFIGVKRGKNKVDGVKAQTYPNLNNYNTKLLVFSHWIKMYIICNVSEYSIPHYIFPKWGKHGANRGQTSKASHLATCNISNYSSSYTISTIHKILFAWPWYKLLWWKMSLYQDPSNEMISTQIILHGAVYCTEVNQMSNIYVTGIVCNEAFHEIIENFSHFLKWLIQTSISWNGWNL